MATPKWAQGDEQLDEAKAYLREGGTIDFYELITRNIITHQPTNLAAFSLEIIEKLLAGSEVEAESTQPPKKLEDARYLNTAKVSEFIDAWVLALLEAQPQTDAERMHFHRQYIKSLLDQ